MHVGAAHVSNNFSRVFAKKDKFSCGLVHKFYEGVVVHLMEGLVVPDFNDTATTEIYTLSLHDALPIYRATLVSKRGGSDLYIGSGVVFLFHSIITII